MLIPLRIKDVPCCGQNDPNRITNILLVQPVLPSFCLMCIMLGYKLMHVV